MKCNRCLAIISDEAIKSKRAVRGGDRHWCVSY